MASTDNAPASASAPPILAANGRLVLAAAMVMALVLGSIHAFSVFLEPMEQLFEAPRATVSLTYSFALVALTVAVLFGHHVYARITPPLFATALLVTGAAGAAVAAFASSLPLVWVGYGVIFGAANGFGYGYALQASAQANPGSQGMAMGLVTAAYALGAFLFPVVFEAAIARGGVAGGMTALAMALLVALPVIAALLYRSHFRFQVETADKISGAVPAASRIAILWIGYGTGVAAGLMAIGHATGIARAAGLSGWLVVAAPMAIAIANMAGSFIGGRLIDRIDPKPVLTILPAVSAMALYGLGILEAGIAVLAGLALVGFCYGAIIAAYPAAIAALYGTVAGIRIYGLVFTAWGTAGLLAPWLAGVLFDRSGNYGLALVLAGSLGMVSCLTSWLFGNRRVR